MKTKTVYTLILIGTLALSCKKGQNKDGYQREEGPKMISIKDMVQDFKGDSTIKEIKGIQIEDLFYKEYFVYTGNKKRVLDGINKIKTIDNISSDCSVLPRNEFYKTDFKQEKNKDNAFFWKFEKLKSIEIYRGIKGSSEHFIIFDLLSDTVYHKVEEIR
jgi:hypothetical protein